MHGARSRLSSGVDANGVPWGIAENDRVNAPLTRLMLSVQRPHRIPTRTLRRLYYRLRHVPSVLLGSDFRTANVGPDLYLPHPYGIVVHSGATIGAHCTIYHNVTIGETGSGPGVPTIGDHVLIGTGAVILGPVRVGDGATIGAGALVLDDVPRGAIVVGPKARIISPR